MYLFASFPNSRPYKNLLDYNSSQFSALSPLVAEALAFRLTVMWAWVFDFQHVWFESDAQTLVEALHVGSRCPSSIASCIYDIRTNLDLFSWVKVSHVWRQGNRAAHALASLSSSCLCADSVISHLPAEVLQLVELDYRPILC
ncbi:uncharacterized protein LOC132278063 [Cornus florida]|uniref:uncharacterized protein LOC132278063 n=1 Tax=Cornus florida TaxID=4283 RepID=UPI002897B4F7|nr:uncharacterized protein LOC132278063 [Cornus florida]